MTSSTSDTSSTSESRSDAGQLSPRVTRTLQALAALGTASALWAIFLWRELLGARAGEDPFCGFGESSDCGDLWSAAFASTIHGSTGLPVAGWGLVWGLVATVLPLIALGWAKRRDAALPATELTAAAGIAGIVVLLTASAAEGLFCTSCALTYVLTAAYAAVAFFGLRRGIAERSPQGVTLAVAVTLAAYLLLLYPGLRTPKSQAEEGQDALVAATQRASDSAPGADAGSTEAGSTDPGEGDVGANRAAFDRQLDELLASLPPQSLQWLSDSLAIYRESVDRGSLEPRVVSLGSQDGAVKIAEFTDVLCSHCASLHQNMEYISGLLPPESFRVDARHFPLDGNCNRHLQRKGEESVRCLAARAQICMEDTGRLFEFSGQLFKNQQGLTEDQVWELAEPFMDRAALEDCVRSTATERKLRDDVDYAWRHEPHGTPLVLINGRQGTQFGPFLFAMVLTGGDPDHPAFNTLPPANPPQPHDHAH